MGCAHEYVCMCVHVARHYLLYSADGNAALQAQALPLFDQLIVEFSSTEDQPPDSILRHTHLIWNHALETGTCRREETVAELAVCNCRREEAVAELAVRNYPAHVQGGVQSASPKC